MGVVIATGTQTEFGVIFSMMQDVSLKRALDQEHAHLGTGGRKTHASPVEHGRASQKVVDYLLRHHWSYLCYWSMAAAALVGYVHHRG